jgi:hypothetical protein
LYTAADSGRTAWQASQEKTENRWVATDGRVVEVGQQSRSRADSGEGQDAARTGRDVRDPWCEPGDGETEGGTGGGVTDREHVGDCSDRPGPAREATRGGSGDGWGGRPGADRAA